MHLHTSFGDGWSPSSTKRQSSASTSWAWIMVCLSLLSLGVWGAALLWRGGAEPGGDHCLGCAVCRAARLGGPSPRRRSAKAVFGCPALELFLVPELEGGAAEVWRTEGVALGDILGSKQEPGSQALRYELGYPTCGFGPTRHCCAALREIRTSAISDYRPLSCSALQRDASDGTMADASGLRRRGAKSREPCRSGLCVEKGDFEDSERREETPSSGAVSNHFTAAHRAGRNARPSRGRTLDHNATESTLHLVLRCATAKNTPRSSSRPAPSRAGLPRMRGRRRCPN